MMTLDEAIKHCEEVAEQKDLESGFDTDNERYTMTDNERADCKECAREHRQLAEWLKDYKRSLEQEQVLDKIKDEIMDTLYVDSLIFGELIDFKNGKISADDVIEEFNRVTRMEVLRIIDKYRAESEDD